MTITNQQVKLLMKNIKKYPQEVAAAKSGMSTKTGSKYLASGKLPSEMKQKRANKRDCVATRDDTFTAHWPIIEPMLQANPNLQAKTILAFLMNEYPGTYKLGQLRTLQRRVKNWRAHDGSNKDIIFRQDIKPGVQSQSDFTVMNSLNITINGEAFNHILFHFMLPYSRWESVRVCFSESFESLVAGFEKAVWELGYVAPEHRTDNLTAATKAMGSRREFTQSWQNIMDYYNITPTTNNPGVSHENGSVEKSHHLLKTDIDQSLMVRGYRDFDSEEAYSKWLEQLVAGRNKSYLERLSHEVKSFLDLPDKRYNAPTIIPVRVQSSSLVQIMGKLYSVPSRLINYSLRAYVYPDEVILFYNNKSLQIMPRVHDDSWQGINYRHLIDSLIRKPGAFANYRYQAALFPRLCFRQAYDALQARYATGADKSYLKLLQLAKVYTEQQVSEALELLLEVKQVPDSIAVKELIDSYKQERIATEVIMPSLSIYDNLLSCSSDSYNKEGLTYDA